MKKYYFVILLVFLLASFILASPALAMAEPVSVKLGHITIFKDQLVTDDFLAIVPYNIPFTEQPADTIKETFIFSVLSPDGTLNLSSATAYPRYYGGYGKGIVAFYIESGMVWNQSYIFRVQENPVFYPAPQKWDFTISISEYSTEADQSQALRAKILDSAADLSSSWNVDLLTSADGGQTVFSTSGELYFINAVPGLQTMCPSLFSVQIVTPNYGKRAWSYTLAVLLRTKYDGTVIDEFMTGYAGLFSMDKNSAMDITSIVIYVIVILLSVVFFKASMLAAFTDGYAVLLCLMLQGFVSMILVGFIAFLSVLIGGLILFFNR